jgi:hypothetical protein
MTDCQKLKDEEAQKLTKDGNALVKISCPPCPPKICYGKINQCPLHTGKFNLMNEAGTRWWVERVIFSDDVRALVLCLLQLRTFVPKVLVLAAVLPALGTSLPASAMNAVKSNWNAR